MKRRMSIIGYIIFAVFAFIVFLLKQAGYKYNDSDIYIEELILLIILSLGGFLLFSTKISQKIKVGILLVAIALFVSYPVFTDYLVYSHDINFHLVRIEGLAESIKDLQIPARINSIANNGYGYATPMFYPELFLYFPAFLKVLNVSTVFVFKLLIIAINIMSVFFMYIAVKNISKSSNSGIISAIVYAAANYRLENVFTRAAVGEALALCFLPLAIWGLYELLAGDKKKWYVFVIGISGIIQSHILSVMFAGILCAIFGFVFIDKIIIEKRYKEIAISVVAILLLNLWFVVPFLDGYRLDLNVKGSGAGYVFYEYPVIPAQLFNFYDSASAYNLTSTTEAGMKEDMSYTLGILCSIGLVLCVYYSFKHKNDKDTLAIFLKTLTFLAVLFLILSTTIIPWKELQESSKLINTICTTMQFSWRFLGITTVSIAMAFGIILGNYVDTKQSKEKDFYENKKIIIGILLIALFTVPYFLRDYSKEDVFITKETKLNYNLFGQNEYFLKNTDTSKLDENRYVTSNTNIKITSYEKNKDKIIIEYVSLMDDGYIEVPLLYYPGYSATDGKGNNLDVTIGDNNVVRINLKEKGNGTIKVEYKQKLSYVIANIISILALVGGTYFIVRRRK